MAEADHGCEELETAARGDFPAQFVRVVGSRVNGDQGTVWFLTNDRPPFEPYEVNCERRNDRWYVLSGSGGFSLETPDDVLAKARGLGWS